MKSKAAVRVLQFIQGHVAQHGVTPLHKEIAHHMGWQSHGSVQRALKQLAAEGRIIRGPRRFDLAEETEQEMIREEERQANGQFGVGA